MCPSINSKMNEIEISGIRQFFNKVSQYEDVVTLTIGQPDFPTPDHVKEAGISAIRANKTSYTPNAGILPLRKAIANYINNRLSLSYDPLTEIIVTVGASQALDATLRTILESGDDVLLPGPVYPGYEPIIRLSGANPVYVDTRENQFKLTADLIKPALTSRTKAIILPYPSNPTGVTLDKQELEEIALLAKDHDFFIVADEIYSELTYSTEHFSIARYTDIRDQVIVINGLSKSFSMTGWRVGYILADATIAKEILKVHQYNVSCTSSIGQYAALEALTSDLSSIHIMKNAYQDRRDYLLTRLDQLGISYATPQGAFYVFPKLPNTKQTSWEWALKLVEEGKVAVVPGSGFSSYGEGYFRISYAYDMETLVKGMDRLEAFLSN